MNYTDIINFYGNQTAAGAAVGLAQCSISIWRKAGAIPINYQCQYEIITNGKLKACRKTLAAIKKNTKR